MTDREPNCSNPSARVPRVNNLVLFTFSIGVIFIINLFVLMETASVYLQALHTFGNDLLTPIDNHGNTIAHIAAAGGHVSIFKVHQLLLSL